MGSEETDQVWQDPLAKKATGNSGELLKIATTRWRKPGISPLAIPKIYYEEPRQD